MRGNKNSFAKAINAAKLMANEPGLKYDVVTCVSGRNMGLYKYSLPLFARQYIYRRLYGCVE